MGVRIKTLDELKATVKAYMEELWLEPDDDEPSYSAEQIIEAVCIAANEWGDE